MTKNAVRFFFSVVVFVFSFVCGSQFAAVAAEVTPAPTGAVSTAADSDWVFNQKRHVRLAFHTVNNTVDLRNDNHDDRSNYVGYAYDYTLDIRHIKGFEQYFFIERRGRADYDAPLFGDKSLHTLFGRYRWYTGYDALPRIREFWSRVPLNDTQDIYLKAGLFPYGRDIGNGIALGGKYENYGLSLTGESDVADWNVHWEALDANNRVHLGPVTSFDKITSNNTHANFTAADTTLKMGDQSVQFYWGWIQDSTPPAARASSFTAVVKDEDLYTAGFHAKKKIGKLTIGFEGARNYGEAVSVDISRSNSVQHDGYLMVGDASYDLGSFKPKYRGIIASGNKIDETNFQNGTFPGDRNHAFSVFSPLNNSLTDSHYQKKFGPYVAMAGGYCVNFGVQRPGTFGDPFLFENIAANTIGFDYTPVKKVYIGVDLWNLRTMENGFGIDNRGVFKELSSDLGNEIDLFVSYQLKENIKLSLLTGYFMPGAYYGETRRDTPATSTLSPTPRRDGSKDGAYQLELGIDITF